MITRRLMYITALAGSLLFYILSSYWFSWYLFVLVILLIPLDLLVSLPGMLTKRLVLTAPKVLEQDADGLLVALTLQSNPLPVRCIKARLHITGDDFSLRRRITCGAGSDGRYELIIDTARTGLTSFEIKRIWAISLIGLFSMPVPINCKVNVLVLPAPVKPVNNISLPRSVTLRPKPGGGFSEDHDLRPYRPGDQIRSIHWKVSAKHDLLIVRDPLSPLLQSRLIQVAKWNEPRERDLILGRLLWISNYLLESEFNYFLRLGDHPTMEITRATDLVDYLYHVLSGTSYLLMLPASLPLRFAWELRIDASEGVL